MTDGTGTGTALAGDIVTGATSSNPYALTGVGSTLFFAGLPNPPDALCPVSDSCRTWIYRSDGTEAGTTAAFAPPNSPGSLSHVGELAYSGGVLFFTFADQVGLRLFRLDSATG
jgi:hypothetical protein